MPPPSSPHPAANSLTCRATRSSGSSLVLALLRDPPSWAWACGPGCRSAFRYLMARGAIPGSLSTSRTAADPLIAQQPGLPLAGAAVRAAGGLLPPGRRSAGPGPGRQPIEVVGSQRAGGDEHPHQFLQGPRPAQPGYAKAGVPVPDVLAA